MRTAKLLETVGNELAQINQYNPHPEIHLLIRIAADVLAYARSREAQLLPPEENRNHGSALSTPATPI